MNSKSWCSLAGFPRATSSSWRWRVAQARVWTGGVLAFYFLLASTALRASDAPPWMHALANVPLPEHDEKTDAVLLYSEHIFTVQPNGKIKPPRRAADTP